MSECPKMVDELIQCVANTGYDILQLLATLDLDSSQQPFDHGKW